MNAVWQPGPAGALGSAVHLWRADLDAQGRDPAALGLLLSRDERARAADIRDAGGQRRFVTRRALHRILLGSYAVGSARGVLQTAVGALGADALFAFGGGSALGVSIVPVPCAAAALGRLPGLGSRERLGLGRLEAGRRGPALAAVLALKDALAQACDRPLDAAIEAVEVLGPVLGAGPGAAIEFEVDGLSFAGRLIPLAADRVAGLVHDGGPRLVRTFAVAG